SAKLRGAHVDAHRTVEMLDPAHFDAEEIAHRAVVSIAPNKVVGLDQLAPPFVIDNLGDDTTGVLSKGNEPRAIGHGHAWKATSVPLEDWIKPGLRTRTLTLRAEGRVGLQ